MHSLVYAVALVEWLLEMKMVIVIWKSLQIQLLLTSAVL